MSGDIGILRKELDELQDMKDKLARLLDDIKQQLRANDDSIRQIQIS